MDGHDALPVLTLLRWMKEGPPGAIPIQHGSRSLGSLQVVSWEDAGDRAAVTRLARWHEHAFSRFSAPPPVTPEGARQWLVDRVLQATNRILFWARNVRGEAVGHVGLGGIDPSAGTVEIIDVLTGERGGEVLVTAAVDALAGWVRDTLGLVPMTPLSEAA